MLKKRMEIKRMFKKVCVILTSLCLLTACSVNEDLVKDKEAKTKDEKTSEVSKNTTSKVSEEKKEKESFKSSDESSSKKETSKQNEAPAQKKDQTRQQWQKANQHRLKKKHPVILPFLLRQKMKLRKQSRNQHHLYQALRQLSVREDLIQVFPVTSFRMEIITLQPLQVKAKPLPKASIIWIRSCILASRRSPITPFSPFIETIRPLPTMG